MYTPMGLAYDDVDCLCWCTDDIKRVWMKPLLYIPHLVDDHLMPRGGSTEIWLHGYFY